MKKVLVIVAHPDDEVIWMGGLLIRNKIKWDTTIISLCRASDKDRNPKFQKVCKKLNVKGFIFDLNDKNLDSLNQEEILNILKKFSGKYDYIFTHGKNGEYGHIRHKECNKTVIKCLNQGLLKSKNVFLFSYIKKENNYQNFCIYNSSADKLIKLNNKELSEKKYLIKKIYGFQKGGFEEKSCSKMETFDKLK